MTIFPDRNGSPCRYRIIPDTVVRESIAEERVLKKSISEPDLSFEVFHYVPVNSMNEPFVQFPEPVHHVQLLFLAEIVHDRDEKPLILFLDMRRVESREGPRANPWCQSTGAVIGDR
ncbi:hypothetical protein MUP29_06015 [bacterium]|nr:hypothetical protein [bacterium]